MPSLTHSALVAIVTFLVLQSVNARPEYNCTFKAKTDSTVSSRTCEVMADRANIYLHDFLNWNPSVRGDCSNILPNTEYCLEAEEKLVESKDGFCGPQHGNASCLGFEYPDGTIAECCNSRTWKCGGTLEDCQEGICYSDSCNGLPDFYSLDGKCGKQHDNKQCGGVWGNCCNMEGQCGKGPDFCSIGKCQSGAACDVVKQYIVNNLNLTSAPPVGWGIGNTTDGTCGGEKAYTCNSVYGNCKQSAS
ncbi:hypothetical protein EJ06DRAFT_515265 [Trichodelitschia bisporula]|uniref:Chitin-binding type-1 domain-containing protein n=1 Tax=Trichodelitschia bisporula TaxID=703511 RepID=A0A6G1HMF7_9PEZI|nr:hypothetical protein EJ06DRAFT_515265 [Trichodelitschia bisporula]